MYINTIRNSVLYVSYYNVRAKPFERLLKIVSQELTIVVVAATASKTERARLTYVEELRSRADGRNANVTSSSLTNHAGVERRRRASRAAYPRVGRKLRTFRKTIIENVDDGSMNEKKSHELTAGRR